MTVLRGFAILCASGILLVWIIYPRTFVVTQVDEMDVLGRLRDAQTFTAEEGQPALVTFARKMTRAAYR